MTRRALFLAAGALAGGAVRLRADAAGDVWDLLASVASLSSWDGLLAGFLLTPIPWLLLMTGGSVALPMAGALVVGSTVAAAVRFLRLRQTGASCGFGLSRNVVMIQPDVRVY